MIVIVVIVTIIVIINFRHHRRSHSGHQLNKRKKCEPCRDLYFRSAAWAFMHCSIIIEMLIVTIAITSRRLHYRHHRPQGFFVVFFFSTFGFSFVSKLRSWYSFDCN